MNLTGNTILVTGGTSGIGFELALQLLNNKNNVIALGTNPAKLRMASEAGLFTIACDLQSKEQIEDAVLQIQNSFPELNVLVNNAGIQNNYRITDGGISFERIRSEIDINLTGQIYLTYLLIPQLAAREGATIINTTSGLGAIPKPDGLVYSCSKAALRNFTTGLRTSLKTLSIDVLEIIPPVTDTGMTSGRDEPKMSTELLVRKLIPQIAKGKDVATVFKMRIFLWLSRMFPSVALRMMSSKS